jgi:dTDP-4-amino-4,6-dideoxygalactose transaminase
LRAHNEPQKVLKDNFGEGQAYFPGSGTAALTLALKGAKAMFPDVATPRVIIPAYGCPDLVSAADAAGVDPILVDLEKGRSWLSLERLHESLTDEVIAVVAVSLLGIRERLGQIAKLLQGHRAILIEDNAQYIPMSPQPDTWYGDVLVFSFGRGKPATMLAGGLLVLRDKTMQGAFRKCIDETSVDRFSKLGWRIKAAIYNALRRPAIYGAVSRIPFSGIGETRYKPPKTPSLCDARIIALAADSIVRYQRANHRRACSDHYAESLRDCSSGFSILGAELGGGTKGSLIRFPLLAPSRYARDEAYSRLLRRGLGPSVMYNAPIPGVPGIDDRFGSATAFPNACDFAAKLLTLPTHSGVTDRHLEQISQIMLSLR